MTTTSTDMTRFARLSRDTARGGNDAYGELYDRAAPPVAVRLEPAGDSPSGAPTGPVFSVFVLNAR